MNLRLAVAGGQVCLGAVCLLLGVGMLSVPAALMVAGVLLIALGLFGVDVGRRRG